MENYGCETMCTSIKGPRKKNKALCPMGKQASLTWAFIRAYKKWYFDQDKDEFHSTGGTKRLVSALLEKEKAKPYLSPFRTRAPSSSTISGPLLQPFLWRVWRE